MPTLLSNEGDDVKVERVAIAAMVVGALAVGGILLFGPRNAPTTGVHAAPVAQSIVPSGYPYSSLAILREQRTTDDVLPKFTGSIADEILPTTAHHLLTSRAEDIWIAANAEGGFCAFSTSPGDSGGSGLCSKAEPNVVPGTELAGYGSGAVTIEIVSDGAPVAGAIDAGFRQIAPNVWMKGRGTVVRHPQVAGDPFAFPLAQPFKSFSILRRARTAADAAPSVMTTEPSGNLASYRQDEVRYGGTFDGVKGYVTINTAGQACFLVDGTQVAANACVATSQIERGQSVAQLGVQGADGKDVVLVFYADGKLSADDAKGMTRLGPNVYGALTN